MDRVGLQNGKAGLRKVDKQKADEIIYNASKDSKYYKNELKKQEKSQLRLAEWKQIISSLQIPPFNYENMLSKAANSIDTSRIIAHFDFDYFYCQVEELDDPSLKNKPMAVGGMHMLSTTNYKAREYGIRAGMPGFIALQLNKDLVMVPLHFDKYIAASKIFKHVLSQFSDSIQGGGLDEAFIDLTEFAANCNLSIDDIISNIRQQVFNETGLTCSAGVGVNKLIAKIASDQMKPNGQFIVPFDGASILEFMSTLSIKRIHGIGKVSNFLLNGIGVQTCSDVYNMTQILKHVLLPKQYEHLIDSSLGLGDNILNEGWERKSISAERTFTNLSNQDDILLKLKDICDELGKRVEKEGLSGNQVGIKLKLSSFELKTRSFKVPRFVSTSEEIYEFVMQLILQEFPLELRLLGVRLAGLQGEVEETILDKFLETPDKSTQENVMTCPICNAVLTGLSITINKHLDRCLNLK